MHVPTAWQPAPVEPEPSKRPDRPNRFVRHDGFRFSALCRAFEGFGRSLFFDYGGAVARRPFAIGMIAMHVAVLATGAVCVQLIRNADAPSALVVGAALTVLLVAWLWALFALLTKRLRSLWLNPAPVLVGFVLVELVDNKLLSKLTELRFFWPVDANTPAAGALVAIFWIVLFFMPAQERDGSLRFSA